MNKFNDDLSLQEIFDLSYLHVLKQGKPSVDEKGGCLYRGPNGLMCAAGPFLTEQEAGQYEGDSWSSINKFSLRQKNLLVTDLQSCHDSAVEVTYDDNPFLETFKSKARAVAIEYGLTIPEGESK